jgi:SAM-dependent methyltransferase
VTEAGTRYDTIGTGYAATRREDPELRARIHAALGDARTVVNVGAGAGSYEPRDRHVVAIEPSDVMAAQRPPGLAPAIRATAAALPLRDGAVDAAMAILTIHHWDDDRERGMRELRRVARGPVVILTFDGDALDRFWLARYVPELVEADRRRFPALSWIVDVLGGRVTVDEVPVPRDCTDGFTEAFYARPERFLDEGVRRSQSVWTFVDPAVEARFVRRLAADLDSGEWDRRFGHHRQMPAFDGALRLITAHPR